MPSGSTNRNVRKPATGNRKPPPGGNRNKRKSPASAVTQRQVPWLAIGGVVLIVALAAVFIGYPLLQRGEQRSAQSELQSAFGPTDENRDPSSKIPGVVTEQYGGGQHIEPTQRVAYTKNPPFGGAHDGYWAACNGVVYPNPVRVENLVHSLEHGAVWIAYNPDQVSGPALDTLKAKVDGQPYTVMSPYPGLGSPISLQSWGHQLAIPNADDQRIDQFITALRQNRFAYPEVGASCEALGPGAFDQDNPPPFQPIPPASAVDNQTVFPENLGTNGVAADAPAGGAAPGGAAPGGAAPGGATPGGQAPAPAPGQ